MRDLTADQKAALVKAWDDFKAQPQGTYDTLPDAVAAFVTAALAAAPGLAGEEVENLREFAAWTMAAHLETLEGCDIEDKAVELGLMDRVEAKEPCGEGCQCADYGFPSTCYRPKLRERTP